MKTLLAASLALAMTAQSNFAADSDSKPDFKDPKQKFSYAVGSDIASNLKKQGIEIDAKALAAGLADTIAGKSALSREEMMETISAFQKELMAKMEAKQKNAEKDGKAFLEANGKKEGVKTTASGLQYKVIKSGKGKSPKASDKVKVHYHGTLIDGTVFDSSVERNDPITFPVNGVIPGWVEGLQLMKEGDKFQFVIPSNLAYGEQGAGGKIGPNSTLIFDVELISVESAQ